MLGAEVFYAACDAATEALGERYRSWLSPDERAASARMASQALRDEYLVTRALCRWTLSRFEPSVDPGAWQFERTEAGRPFVVGPHRVPFQWNLSHAGGIVVCAVSSYDVGVDVEPCSRGSDLLRTASKMFSPAENRALDALPEEERARRAVHLWTTKEAYLKARGDGISVRLTRFGIVANGDRYALGEVSVLGDDPRDWQIDVHEVADQAEPCTIAVALRRGAGPSRDEPPTPFAAPVRYLRVVAG